MNFKTIFAVLVLMVVFNALFVFFGGLDILMRLRQQETTQSPHIQTDVVDVFRFTLEDEVQKKVGIPMEGYEPSMFLRVFPGLVETDFDGVQASLGQYHMSEGVLIFTPDPTKLVHSAAHAITRHGYATLLQNIATRIGIDLSTDGTITDIMRSLTYQG